jgi:hypothetical protein
MSIARSSAPAARPWRENDLLRGLDPDQLTELAVGARVIEFQPGERLVSEGEEGREVFLIEAGEVEVLKAEDRFVIARLGPGEAVGTLALVDRAPRSASVRAGARGCRAARLDVDDLHWLGMRGGGAEATVLRNLLRSHTEDVRRTSERVVEALQRELEATRARLALGSFVGYVMLIMCAYGFVLRQSLVFAGRTGVTTLVTTGILAVYAATLLVMIRRSGYPRETYGLTLRNWPRDVAVALTWTAGFAVVLTGLKWLAVGLSPALAREPFLRLAFVREDLGFILPDALLYGAFAPVQELVARGAMQGSLMKLLSGRFVTTRAILISTLAFTATHLHLSIGFALVSAVPSIFWGVLFARRRSLLGVSVSHVLLGWFAVYVLGVPGIR